LGSNSATQAGIHRRSGQRNTASSSADSQGRQRKGGRGGAGVTWPTDRICRRRCRCRFRRLRMHVRRRRPQPWFYTATCLGVGETRRACAGAAGVQLSPRCGL